MWLLISRRQLGEISVTFDYPRSPICAAAVERVQNAFLLRSDDNFGESQARKRRKHRMMEFWRGTPSVHHNWLDACGVCRGYRRGEPGAQRRAARLRLRQPGGVVFGDDCALPIHANLPYQPGKSSTNGWRPSLCAGGSGGIDRFGGDGWKSEGGTKSARYLDHCWSAAHHADTRASEAKKGHRNRRPRTSGRCSSIGYVRVSGCTYPCRALPASLLSFAVARSCCRPLRDSVPNCGRTAGLPGESCRCC